MLQTILAVGSFVFGLVILVYGADLLVKGSSSIAKKAGLSPLFIGLTIVAFGTSLPELVVNLFASFKGSNDIAIGNVLGSNISNILLILGIAAIIYPLSVRKSTVAKEVPFSLLAIVVLYILVNDFIIDGLNQSILSRGDGLILLAFFLIFLYYTFSISKNSEAKEQEIKTYKHWLSTGLVLGGMIGLVVGGNMMTDGAVNLARYLGVSEALIGLTVVAIGTSLPELAASAVAAYRHHSDIAIGNIIGSNIFNIFWILGLSAVIRPLSFSVQMNSDIIILAFITILLLFFMFAGKRNILQRWQGSAMVSLYVIYIIYLIYQG
ncbi:MAG: calcium/sodium antiporter [Candidatus Buchananbacteria bacterium]|nr:calcium/sodium antiporter [Candidatus Buchananbacteria bacterium]